MNFAKGALSKGASLKFELEEGRRRALRIMAKLHFSKLDSAAIIQPRHGFFSFHLLCVCPFPDN